MRSSIVTSSLHCVTHPWDLFLCDRGNGNEVSVSRYDERTINREMEPSGEMREET